MKRRYVTKQILLACKARPAGSKKDIHTQLEETIGERRKILPVWERLYLKGQPVIREEFPVVKKDIHAQLAETIAEYKKIKNQSQRLFGPGENNNFLMQEKNAA